MQTNHGIELETDQAIATLRFNLPERHNALAGPQLETISDYLQQLQENPTIRVLIVTASGTKTFCAGAELGQLNSGAISGDSFASMTDCLAALPLPTICAFNGSAYGGGAEIGLACDFRVGFAGMRLFVPPARIGLCYPVNGIERFVTTLGVNAAKRLLLASEEFNGTQLHQLGYLTHLAEKDEIQHTVSELAQRLAGYAPLALTAMKQICNQAARATLDKPAAHLIAQHCNSSADLREGFLAMSEKRPPLFNGE